jgi:hypothetical protein
MGGRESFMSAALALLGWQIQGLAMLNDIL